MEPPRQGGVGRGSQGRVVVAEHGAGEGGGGGGAGRVGAPHSGDDGQVVVVVLLTVAAAAANAARRQGVVRGRQGPATTGIDCKSTDKQTGQGKGGPIGQKSRLELDVKKDKILP